MSFNEEIYSLFRNDEQMTSEYNNLNHYFSGGEFSEVL